MAFVHFFHVFFNSINVLSRKFKRHQILLFLTRSTIRVKLIISYRLILKILQTVIIILSRLLLLSRTINIILLYLLFSFWFGRWKLFLIISAFIEESAMLFNEVDCIHLRILRNRWHTTRRSITLLLGRYYYLFFGCVVRDIVLITRGRWQLLFV